jgi:hypothetical protein
MEKCNGWYVKHDDAPNCVWECPRKRHCALYEVGDEAFVTSNCTHRFEHYVEIGDDNSRDYS